MAFSEYLKFNNALIKGWKICRSVDRWTTKLSFYELRIFCGDNPVEDVLNTREERIKIDYWNLFVKRCIQESKSIQEKNWISPDDVMSVSSTATIAIPGMELFR